MSEPPTGDAPETGEASRPPATAPPQQEIELESLLRSRAPTRRRLLQSLALLLVLAVIAAVIMRSVVSQSGQPQAPGSAFAVLGLPVPAAW